MLVKCNCREGALQSMSCWWRANGDLLISRHAFTIEGLTLCEGDMKMKNFWKPIVVHQCFETEVDHQLTIQIDLLLNVSLQLHFFARSLYLSLSISLPYASPPLSCSPVLLNSLIFSPVLSYSRVAVPPCHQGNWRAACSMGHHTKLEQHVWGGRAICSWTPFWNHLNGRNPARLSKGSNLSRRCFHFLLFILSALGFPKLAGTDQMEKHVEQARHHTITAHLLCNQDGCKSWKVVLFWNVEASHSQFVDPLCWGPESFRQRLPWKLLWRLTSSWRTSTSTIKDSFWT